MGEYIKYKDKEIKIGTLENIYYTSFQKYEKAYKEGLISPLIDNISPGEYIKPDSGFRFRFPFPDEDKLPFGDIGKFDHHRGVPVKIDPTKETASNEQWQVIAGKQMQLEITQQKLVHRENDGKLCLALVVRNPESGLSFRIEENPAIRKIINDILSNHVFKSTNAEEQSFYRKIAIRIRDGFRLEMSAKNTKEQSTGKSRYLRKRGRGLR
jgi:hypothetical protein